jgi:hypothetical protein
MDKILWQEPAPQEDRDFASALRADILGGLERQPDNDDGDQSNQGMKNEACQCEQPPLQEVSLRSQNHDRALIPAVRTTDDFLPKNFRHPDTSFYLFLSAIC